MQTGHTPRLYKAFGAFLGGFGLFALSTVFGEKMADILIGAAWVCVAVGIIEGIFIYATNAYELRNRYLETQVQVINAMAAADPDVRNAIGAWFPQYNLRWAGKTITCWQDTIVPVEAFREFMHQSNAQYVAPERDWKAKGATYHRYWNIIYSKLTELGLIVPESAAGSHSHLWRGKGYNRAWEMWMGNGKEISEL